MKSKLKMLVLLSVAVVLSANAMAALTVANGGFETIIGDTGNVIINSGRWTDSVGMGMTAMFGGVSEFSDGSATADLPGWTGNAGVSVVANQGPISGNHSIAINSYNWGNPDGQFAATTVLSDSIGASDGTAVGISIWADGTNYPVVLDLLANGVALTPTSSVDPAMGAGAVEFTRSYDAATMAAVSGQDLTIQFGLAPTDQIAGGGGQVKFDDVTLVPEPATMALLALGGLLIRRKRA